jgi:hypothetical protein
LGEIKEVMERVKKQQNYNGGYIEFKTDRLTLMLERSIFLWFCGVEVHSISERHTIGRKFMNYK